MKLKVRPVSLLSTILPRAPMAPRVEAEVPTKPVQPDLVPVPLTSSLALFLFLK